MGLRKSGWVAAGALTALIVAGVGISEAIVAPEKPRTPVAAMVFEPYEAQKALYHVTESGGWFDRDYFKLMNVANNHLNAVGKGQLDLRIVMQGDGVGLLSAARKNAKLASEVDKLKQKGVRFEVCKNTLMTKNIDPSTELYDVKPGDIVGAGIAEVAALEARGFVYLKP